MSRYNTYEQVEAYLYNNMSAEDRLAFEAALKTDAALAKKLENMRMLEQRVMDVVREEDLLRKLEQWDEELEGDTGAEKKVGAGSSFKGYFIGGVVLLLLSGLWFWNQGRNLAKSNNKEITSTVPAIEVEPEEQKVDSIISLPVDIDKDEKVQAKEDEPSVVAPETSQSKRKTKGTTKRNDNSIPAEILQNSVTPPTNPKDPVKREEPLIKETEDVDQNLIDTTLNIAFEDVDKQIDAFENPADVSTRTTVKKIMDHVNPVTSIDSLKLKTRYALGLSFYKKKDFVEAIKYLEVFGVPDKVHYYKPQAQFVLCMAYLRSGIFEKGEPLLEEIIAADASDSVVKLKENLPALKKAFE